MAARTNSTSLPSPVGGWNARDSLGDMPPDDAVTLTNWFPSTTDVMLRKGFSQYATGLGSQVESLMVYGGGASDKMFAATSGGKFYDVTSAGAVGAAIFTGLTNGRWEHQNISTSGGNFMLCFNGSEKAKGYNGTTWWTDGDGTHDITVVDTATVSNVNLHKNRLWMIKKNSLDAYYLGVQSIAGAASLFSLQAVARKGGYLVDVCPWTMDAGYGLDDMLAFVTSKGEVIVYGGTDPTSYTTWSLVGVWEIGSPVGNRCFMKYAGDLLLIGQDGLSPMSAALQSSQTNPKVQLTNKIQRAVSDAVTNYGATFGWETLYYPKQNMLILNVPVAVGTQEQYVMNTITKNWCRFTGWAANCWALYKDDPYFGGNGFVGKAWDTNADNGVSISAEGAQAFNYFRNPGQLKRFTMMRPTLSTDGATAIYGTINTDFNIEQNYNILAVTPATGAVWDTSLWDSASASWAGGMSITKLWQGVRGIGYCGGVELECAGNGINLRWISTDIVYETGAVL